MARIKKKCPQHLIKKTWFYRMLSINCVLFASPLVLPFHFLYFPTDPPENVTLSANITGNKVCTRDVVNFICTAQANPPVHTYLLYQNDTVIKNMTSSGKLIETMKTPGQFKFRCEANNSVNDIERSNNTIVLTVEGKFAYYVLFV